MLTALCDLHDDYCRFVESFKVYAVLSIAFYAFACYNRVIKFSEADMIKSLIITSTSAAFEWQNDSPYYKGEKYNVYLDGNPILSADTNVFSLFGLSPGREYVLSADGYEGVLRFSTLSETVAVSVRDFGAMGDGVTDDTTAIQTAISCLPEGARLYFPEGVYLTSPLSLKSHITLEICGGATLRGSADRSKYPIIPGSVSNLNGGELNTGIWDGAPIPMYQSLLFAEYCTDITIVGEGVIDGCGSDGGWWDEAIRRGPIKRPRIIFFNRCDGVRLHGVNVKNSPNWNIHPYFSKNIDIIGVTVEAPKDSPNTDAIDPEACDRVDIIGCRLSVGDDCIAIKSGKIELAKLFKRPASRHTVRNCLMQFGHGALTLGSELGGGVTDLTVSKCLFDRTDRGLRIKTRRGRGKLSVIDGVCFENILMNDVLTPIVINAFYNCDSDGHDEYVQSRDPLPIDDRTPHLGDFIFRDIVCQGCEVAACYCEGLPERPIESISFVRFEANFKENAKSSRPAMCDGISACSRGGMFLRSVGKLTLEDVKLRGVVGDELICERVGSVIKK